MIGRRDLLTIALASAIVRPALAQDQKQGVRVGVLVGSTTAEMSERMSALRLGLAEVGYSEPDTLSLLVREAHGYNDRLTDLARELVQAGCFVIIATSTAAVRGAAAATRTIPIISASASDLSTSGLVATLARPGGNVTGLTQQRGDLAGKHVEIIAGLVPDLAHPAVLRGPGGGAGTKVARLIQETAAAQRIAVQDHQVPASFDAHSAVAAIAAAKNQAIILYDGPLLVAHRHAIAEAAVAHGLPVLSSSREFTEAGALVSYGPNPAELYRRVGYFVHRIASGASAADLPVEQPTKFELVINARTARALSLAIPPATLARADEVIE